MKAVGVGDIGAGTGRMGGVSMLLLWVALCSVAVIFSVSMYQYGRSQGEQYSSLRASDNILAKDSATGYDDDANSQSPNFIIILADDLGWNGMSYTSQYSGENVGFATPIISNMATKGLILDSFYGQEVCSPARAALLTGRYPLSVGMQYGMVAANTYWGLDLSETLLPEVLRENGYATHALGKWHLGYFNPRYLPTARGFDTFTGYQNGETYYWSKHNTDYPDHIDLIESDTECYAPYARSDIDTYSTYLYRDRAVEIIEAHDTSIPLFMYIAFQAVHDPYSDIEDDSRYEDYLEGLPSSYLSTSTATQLTNKIAGVQRQQYVSSLSLMDGAIGDISTALTAKGMDANTYIIFMSDIGGCHESGGRNGPLRGSKGSLFEGDTRVPAFIYAPSLLRTTGKYYNLFHITDWFPTILSLAGLEYTPDDDFELDGVDHTDSWLAGGANSIIPRGEMLYNMYIDLVDYKFDIWTNGSFAVRDHR
jgi:arylsulfatase A-like enzyme